MVRRVEVEGSAVKAAARSFGFSRQSYYTAAAALACGGLPALVPAKPGPRRAHKLSEQVLDHLDSLRSADPTLRTRHAKDAGPHLVRCAEQALRMGRFAKLAGNFEMAARAEVI